VHPKSRTALSKFLSFVLRHRPQAIGLTLDANGWASVDELVEKCRAHGRPISREIVAEIVASNSKRRLALSDDGARIRASQGHSIDVDLAYEPVEPPEMLFHGTVTAALDAIRAEGLKKMGRHHVHLSLDAATAAAVGMRRGRPVVLSIAAGRMQRDGHVFFCSANGVWLTDVVPPAYIDWPSGPRADDV
jgi:putative RNA 2'-phosphotransferase